MFFKAKNILLINLFLKYFLSMIYYYQYLKYTANLKVKNVS